MYNFFVDDNNRREDKYYVSGSDYNHIVNVLRMKTGERLLISDGGQSNLCEITEIAGGKVTLTVIEESWKNAELPVKITVFQGLPKSDKMELIIQKAVELGVESIVPVEMKRCVVKLDEKKKLTKVIRWQSISESSAKQAKRNIIPEIKPVVSFNEALLQGEKYDLVLVPYENERGMAATREALSKVKKGMRVAVFIGSEGGFDFDEIEKAKAKGFLTVSLGERILRTETAAIASVTMLMLHCELNMGDDSHD